MDFLKAIQICAFRDVTSPNKTPQYFQRHVYRWYSKTFNTPLHMALELPFDEILVHFYEEKYESLEGEGLEHTKAYLMETDEERIAREKAEEAAESEETERIKEIAQEEQARLARIAAKKGALVEKTVKDPLLEKDVKNPFSLEDLAEKDVLSTPLGEPLIEMKFVDDASFEKQVNGLGTMDEPEK